MTAYVIASLTAVLSFKTVLTRRVAGADGGVDIGGVEWFSFQTGGADFLSKDGGDGMFDIGRAGARGVWTIEIGFEEGLRCLTSFADQIFGSAVHIAAFFSEVGAVLVVGKILLCFGD